MSGGEVDLIPNPTSINYQSWCVGQPTPGPSEEGNVPNYEHSPY